MARGAAAEVLVRMGGAIRSSRALWCQWPALVALVCALSAAGADRPRVPTFPVGVEVVLVDVVVLDGADRPVRGLKREDFIVLEDGRPQMVVGFEAYEKTASTEPPSTDDASLASHVVSNETPSDDPERNFALVIDDLGLDPIRGTPAVKKAVAIWLKERTDAHDEVTLVTTSGDVWWTDRVGRGREELLAMLNRVAGKASAHKTEAMSAWEAFRIPNEFFYAPQNPCASGMHNMGGLRTLTDRVIERWIRLGSCFCCGLPDPEACLEGCAAQVRMRAQAVHQRTIARQRTLLGTIERVSQAFSGRRGRKSIMVFTEVFIKDTHDTLSGAFQNAIDASRRANTVINFIDARGLVTASLYTAASNVAPNPLDVGAIAVEETLLVTGGAEYVADETGGFLIRNTNDVSVGLDRMENESTAYYLLGFKPEKPPDGKWHELEVRASRPGVKVQARRGYFARPAPRVAPRDTKRENDERHTKRKGRDSSSPKSRALDPAILAAGAQNDVPLRIACYILGPAEPDSIRLLVALEIDMRGIERVTKNGASMATLALTILALSRDHPTIVPLDERLEVVGSAETEAGWLELTRELRVPPGVTQVRTLVRNVRRDARGTVAQRIEAPDPRQFYISTPILSDRIISRPDKARQVRLRPVAHRRFHAQGILYCLYEVFGAARPQLKGSPQVAGGYTLQAQDGAVVASSPPTLIASDTGRSVSRLLACKLDDLAPGVYELVLDIEDRLAGRTLSTRETFVVESP
jgi:VWFA-related protein